MGKVKWLGREIECDICNKEFGLVFYDAKTTMGPWALMCELCFNRYGIQLGLGYGQMYDTKTKEKIAG